MTTASALLILLPSVFYIFKFLHAFNSDKFIFQKGNNISGILNLTSVLALITCYIQNGSHSLELITYRGLGLSLRIDSISVVVFTMVSIILYFVYRFSVNYLAGDDKFRRFSRAFSLIAATVQLLVIAGNLLSFYIFWVITSIGLSQLLTLYPERSDAIRAAKTKFILARVADLTLLSAFIFIYTAAGTGEIQQLLYDSDTYKLVINSPYIHVIAILLAFTAVIKSVQFPFHTWIFGVLESPTSVSALLHAGLLNAGPFLIIRFSNYIAGIESASTLLLIWGAVSAIFGSAVYITQSSVKTGLVFSSIAHMGFSLMLCGLGIYSAALLHLVSHSFYKAYLFLNSGSAIEELRAGNYKLYERKGNFFKILMSLLLAITIYLAINLLASKFIPLSPSLTFIGYIITTGVFSMLAYSIDSNNTVRTTLKIVGLAILTVTLFHFMEHTTNAFTALELPHIEALGDSRTIAISIIALVFFGAALLQIVVMTPAYKNAFTALRVHMRNGLYVETWIRKLTSQRK